jgi:hypothetical protein
MFSLMKVLPHGIPEMIHDHVEDFGALDFKVCQASLHARLLN